MGRGPGGGSGGLLRIQLGPCSTVRELQPRKVGQTRQGLQKSWGSKPTWDRIPGVLEEKTADSVLEWTVAWCQRLHRGPSLPSSHSSWTGSTTGLLLTTYPRVLTADTRLRLYSWQLCVPWLLRTRRNKQGQGLQQVSYFLDRERAGSGSSAHLCPQMHKSHRW